MHKLPAVEEARVLMTEGKEWGVWKWLFEKRSVRAAADRATDALSEANAQVKATWSDDLKKAYNELELLALLNGNAKAKRQYEKAKGEAKNIDPKIKASAQRVKQADDEAEQSRLDAEDMFAEAEKHMSASMAREAAEKALESYDLREKAIRKAEAARRG